jgi:superfamily II DNA or RNA helicase
MKTTKWSNCLYINHNIAYSVGILDPEDARYIVKIGSSKCLPARYYSYSTYTPVKTELCRYYYLEDYDCYKLDADLKVHLDHFRVHSSGGIEFYYSGILDILEDYMLDRSIRFTRYDDITDFPPFNPTMFKYLADEEIDRYQVIENYKPNELIEPDPNIMQELNIELSAHQLDIMNKTLDHFANHDRGILNLFCRYGKTRLSTAFSLAAKYKRVLILVPSLYLIEQTRKTWMSGYPSESIITISSDIGDISPTQLDLITKQLETLKQINKSAIVICTYHSSHKLVSLEFDLCVYDEAHRTTGEKSAFNKLVSSGSDLITKKLFLTATMKYYDYRENEDDMLVINSMDNATLYGEVIASVSAREALALQRICPYSIMTIKLQEIEEDDPQIRQLEASIMIFLELEDTPVDDFIRANIKRYIRIALGLLKVVRQYKMRHIITFHRYKKCAKLFQFILEYITKPHATLGNTKKKIIKKSKLDFLLDVKYISGEYAKSTREKVIDDFNTEITLANHHKVLCNAKVLQEGVDIPRCDTVCFVDLKTSAVDTVQSLARCMTWMHDKHAYILIPFDESDLEPTPDPECQDPLDLKYSQYAQQLRLLLRNLVEMDDNIKEYFRVFNARDNSYSGGNVSIMDKPSLEGMKLHCFIDESIVSKMQEIAYEVFSVARDKIKGQYATPEEYHAKVLADWDGDLPLDPDVVYRGWGWHGWNDYLGIDPYMRPSQVRRVMHAVNLECLKNGLPMIDTAIGYREYAASHNLMVQLRPPYDNWCWLLLPDYDSLAAGYYTTKEEIQGAIQRLGIKSISEYEEKQGQGLDARLAPYKMLVAGFYNENIPSIQNLILFISSCYKTIRRRY